MPIDIRQPFPKPHPNRRLLGQLAAGAVTSNGGILYEIVPVFGQSSVSARIKTSGNGGTIDMIFVGPDFDPAQAKDAIAFGSLKGTLYTTGNPAQVPVSAGTEVVITATPKGEGYVIIKFTGTVGAGAITFCDVASQPVCW